MKINITIFLVTCGCMFGPNLVTAEPTSGKCQGVLRQVRDEVIFGAAKGEGVCIINKSELTKVLTICHIGDKCIVDGILDDCKDSGECTEMIQIKSIRRR